MFIIFRFRAIIVFDCIIYLFVLFYFPLRFHSIIVRFSFLVPLFILFSSSLVNYNLKVF